MSKVLNFFHLKTFQLSCFNSNLKHGSVLGAGRSFGAARGSAPEGPQRPGRAAPVPARSRPCVPAPPLPAALRRHRARPVPSPSRPRSRGSSVGAAGPAELPLLQREEPRPCRPCVPSGCGWGPKPPFLLRGGFHSGKKLWKASHRKFTQVLVHLMSFWGTVEKRGEFL